MCSSSPASASIGVADDCDLWNESRFHYGHKVTSAFHNQQGEGRPRSSEVHEDEESSENISMWTVKSLPSTTILKAGLDEEKRQRWRKRCTRDPKVWMNS
jgi:hypothetical protein